MEKKKCYAVHLDGEQVARLEALATAAGQKPAACLRSSAETGLAQQEFFGRGKSLYLVTVRIDPYRLAEFGKALGQGLLDRSRYLFTWCLKGDPAVGVSLWTADSRDHLEILLAPHKAFYSEVIGIEEVVRPEESLRMLMSIQSPKPD